MDPIHSALLQSKPCFIGRIAGIELQTAYDLQNGSLQQIVHDQQELENNAGIHIKHRGSLPEYVKQLLSAYDHCTLIAEWDKKGEVYQITGRGQELIAQRTPTIPKINALSLEPYYVPLGEPSWIDALKGKHIAIIHPFMTTIQHQITKLPTLFPGRQWFSDCTFECIAPPITMAGNHHGRDWQEELNEFLPRLELMDHFDVALVAAGGYGMLIADHIYSKMNRSVIYIGGALQLFFGIIGKRWFTNPEVMKLVNDDWTRPYAYDKPPNHIKVEKGCYW